MRRLAFPALLLLVAALFEPIAYAALSNPMPCCADPGAAMCCPLNGSCAMESCQGKEHGNRLVSLSAFAVPVPVSLPRPADALVSVWPADARPESGFLALFDPPPRA